MCVWLRARVRVCVCSGWVVRVNVSTEVDQMMSHHLTQRVVRVDPTLFKQPSSPAAFQNRPCSSMPGFHRRTFNCQGGCDLYIARGVGGVCKRWGSSAKEVTTFRAGCRRWKLSPTAVQLQPLLRARALVSRVGLGRRDEEGLPGPMVGSERTLVVRRVCACRSACRGDGERLGGQLVRLSARVRVGLGRRKGGWGLVGTGDDSGSA
jgi:hypothetical protein